MVMVRTKFEAAWIKPGFHLDQSGASNKDGPHYVKLLNVILAEKIKGKYIQLTLRYHVNKQNL